MLNAYAICIVVLLIFVFFRKTIVNSAANAGESYLGHHQVAQGSTQPRSDPSGAKMKAITWHGPEDMRVSVVPKPAITHSKDAIVKITSFTVCSGSDGHLYAGEVPNMHAGDIVGHEAMGIVESVGDDVVDIQVNDRVVISFNISCGECSYCLKQQFSSCDVTNSSKLEEFAFGHRTSALFGYSSLLGGGGAPGSQAEWVRVPFADVNLFKIPSDLPDIQALYMSDVLCTSYHGLELGSFERGHKVVIWGLGPIGLATARWAQIRGASQIIGIDLVTERLERASKYLGIQTIDRRKVKSVTDTISKMMPGGPDIAVEAAGFRFPTTVLHKVQRAIGLETDSPDILNECLTAVRKNSTVSILGDYIGYTNNFAIGAVMMKHLTLKSGQCPTQKYFPIVLPYLQSGEFSAKDTFVSHVVSMEDVPKAYRKLHKKEDGYIKIFVSLVG